MKSKNNTLLPLAIAAAIFLYVFMYQPGGKKKEGYTGCGCGK